VTSDIYRYSFADAVPPHEVENTLLLAVVATESLHGEVQTRLDGSHRLDPLRRRCVIDARTNVGRDFNRLFAGLLVRQFGANSFRVERLDRRSPEPAPA